MGNPVVHFELQAPDDSALAKFYSELFGWHVQPMPEMSYNVVDTHAGKGINGGFGQSDKPFATIYVAVDDPQAALDKAAALGGKIVMPVTEIPNVVTLAQFTDIEGNLVGIVKGGEDGPGVSEGSNPPVAWFEIVGNEPKKLWDFYRELFGWEIKESETDQFVYGEVQPPDGKGIGGGIGSGEQGPMISVWASVDDLQKYLDRAQSLGAKTIVPPRKVDEHLEIAMFVDVQGVPFGLFRFNS
jgi:predicted enzyme related to lactoylglutathione lyase